MGEGSVMTKVGCQGGKVCKASPHPPLAEKGCARLCADGGVPLTGAPHRPLTSVFRSLQNARDGLPSPRGSQRHGERDRD